MAAPLLASMLFNSVSFLIFFPIVTGLYFAVRGSRARVFLLLAASCVFYMAFVPRYILILGFTIVVDYAAGLLIARSTTHRRTFLMASLIANVGVLAIFKYYPFLVDNTVAIGRLLGREITPPLLKVMLPIGLSFHTFQAMSYTIEVYRGRQEPERDFLVYSLYVLFYPQLVAGPIERPQNLLPQFRRHHRFDVARVTSGLRRMAWGLFKKVVVADRLAAAVDPIYDNAGAYHGLALIIATIMFAFQIYLDFSAYTDVALGAAKVMGFELMENFQTPYLSRSVSEFWRRWHISLSTWFKDYVYVPLGGSRTTRTRHYRNLMVVFMLSGLWHGASWTFVVWGALHGIYLICGQVTAPIRARIWAHLPLAAGGPVRDGAALVTTFTLVAFAWIFFRARTIGTSVYVASHLLSGLGGDLRRLFAGDLTVLPIAGFGSRAALVALVLAAEWWGRSWQRLDTWLAESGAVVRYAVYLILIYGTILGSSEGSAQQFIYFQF